MQNSGWDEDHWQYYCEGCNEYHPSFWKTVTESRQWKAWQKEQEERAIKCKCFDKVCTCKVFDIAESTECNALSPEHWSEFVKFIVGKK